jgi:hypothetical protein
MKVGERFETIDGTEMYRISNFDAMDPFLMTIVSDSDLWMFASTTGGLTAGRVDAANCIFPYETDDRLHAAGGRVGPATVMRVRTGDGTILWEPFHGAGAHTRRSLAKSLHGNSVIIEEQHRGLGLTFRYRWAPSDRFGWVRTATLLHDGSEPALLVEIVDGLLGVMPWGIDTLLQQRMSSLANAYRRSELAAPGLALFTLEAAISDRPEPSEALRATTVWAAGLNRPSISVDGAAIARTRAGKPFQPANLLTGRPGAFLLHDEFEIGPHQELRWHLVADVAQSHADIAALQSNFHSDVDLAQLVDDDIADSAAGLRSIVASADGIHTTNSTKNDAHHFANTLFNVMRGGTFLSGQRVDTARFRTFVEDRHRPASSRHAAWLEALPDSIDVGDLRREALETGDPDLRRLADEYLPVGFSRRHGDPSRPWNQFTIRTKDHRGEPELSYEGNWRDIFQNWEALCRSYPSYLPSIIAKFLNASTPDGFNPYRITSNGIDWEVPEPENPWSGIGYWGDHQIVYLLRLLEGQEAHHPGWLASELDDTRFAFADVPYRITSYEALVRNPKATVDYDEAAEAAVAKRVAEMGADGRLVTDADGRVLHATFLEKLLITMLSKLSNYVPRGGIWMNTERPEWNDANNALVGYGLSMVTLSYLRGYVALVGTLVADRTGFVSVSPEVATWVEAVANSLASNTTLLEAPEVTPEDRARIMRELGTAYDRYRSTVYQDGLSNPRPLDPATVRQLCHAALEHLDDAIRAARRPDGLYHAYNLVRFSGDAGAATVNHLPEMLEGQVAAISSGLLSAEEVTDVLHAMYASALYREDVDSFVLYPATPPPPFLDKNRIPGELVESNPLLVALRDAGSDGVIVRDLNGEHHFSPDFRNARDLDTALDRLAGTVFEPLVEDHRAVTLETFEQVFHHHQFTGRSSSMYAYEGIGSVYWHMVAKLLVAVQEVLLREAGTASQETLEGLLGLYIRVRDGLGFNKGAAEYGAFPTDPYSHTPAHAGAQQPGMTGQVKEELLTRWAELGVTVSDGCVVFTPLLLSEGEFRSEPGTLRYRNVAGEDIALEVDAGQAGLTLCQVPVVLHLSHGESHIVVSSAEGSTERVEGLRLGAESSRDVFDRTDRVVRLDVFMPRSQLHRAPGG